MEKNASPKKSKFVHQRKQVGEFPCDVCGKRYKTHKHLGYHTNNYHREGGYECDICHVNFDTKNKLKTHWNNEHRKERTTCNDCEITFDTRAELLSHHRVVHQREQVGKFPSRSLNCNLTYKNLQVDEKWIIKWIHDPNFTLWWEHVESLVDKVVIICGWNDVTNDSKWASAKLQANLAHDR